MFLMAFVRWISESERRMLTKRSGRFNLDLDAALGPRVFSLPLDFKLPIYCEGGVRTDS